MIFTAGNILNKMNHVYPCAEAQSPLQPVFAALKLRSK
ncbi:hypothetical protein EV14_0545 [Prochlorococcus sp. MIT 0703]|nr:hypothetical protein EV12_1959 [Prochlorococcus sp. MIT 0701]KGG36136.1 hypothetical protein EV14_0545 [Prochlorococcus sp. MIT 0703]